MSKLSPFIAAAAFASLVSCVPPDAPPPRFRPNPPYAPEPVDPYSQNNNVVPPADSTPPPPPPPVTPGSYPTATPTANPDQVISPYEPYNVIDISDPRIPSGKLARDPSNQKIFRVP